jgi:hypothetical protein
MLTHHVNVINMGNIYIKVHSLITTDEIIVSGGTWEQVHYSPLSTLEADLNKPNLRFASFRKTRKAFH